MTQQIDRAPSRRQHVVLAAVTVAAALMLGAVTFYVVQNLSKDDCTTVTNTMPDGSRVMTKTCS